MSDIGHVSSQAVAQLLFVVYVLLIIIVILRNCMVVMNFIWHVSRLQYLNSDDYNKSDNIFNFIAWKFQLLCGIAGTDNDDSNFIYIDGKYKNSSITKYG